MPVAAPSSTTSSILALWTVRPANSRILITGGNALYARMLQWIVEHNPRSALVEVLDARRVAGIARDYAGHVVATLGAELPSFREQDFLGIGCRK